MATRTLSALFGDGLHRRARPLPMHPVVRRRRATALVLIALTVMLGVILVATLGPSVLAPYLPALPMAFVLLWGSTYALRFDERDVQEVEEH